MLILERFDSNAMCIMENACLFVTNWKFGLKKEIYNIFQFLS